MKHPPGNLHSSLATAELRGRRVPMKKSWYPNGVGPESGEAWGRRVPLNSFDRATWARQESDSKASARRAPNRQQLRRYNALISSRRRSSSGTHHLLPFLLWVLDSQDQIRQVRKLQSVQNTLHWNSARVRLFFPNPPPTMSLLPLNISLKNSNTEIMLLVTRQQSGHIYKWLATKVESSNHGFCFLALLLRGIHT